MRTAIIGAGPAGLVLGAALARPGAQVTLVDRDSGPPADGVWARKGVMQFHHAHAIRSQVVDTLRRELPEAYDRLVEVGAEPVEMPLPNGSTAIVGLRCQRSTYEQGVRAAVMSVPGVTLRTGHVDPALEADSRDRNATGLVVDGTALEADLVVDASGRSERVNRDRRAAASASGVCGVCGIAYVDRIYQLAPGAEPGPLVNPIAWQANCDGYQCLVSLHERGIFSALVIRSTDARDLVGWATTPPSTRPSRPFPGSPTGPTPRGPGR
ncbi:MAG: FAD-dependent oxidoreductase [Lapillicoccus sp.]